MDYDKHRHTRETYDRGRDIPARHARDVARTHRRKPSRTSASGDIVDLGCGTGRFTTAVSRSFDAAAVGIDPSKRCLPWRRRERSRPARDLSRRRGGSHSAARQRRPISIFVSMTFHHLKDATEGRRGNPPRPAPARLRLRAQQHGASSARPTRPFFPGFQEIADKLLPTARPNPNDVRGAAAFA